MTGCAPLFDPSGRRPLVSVARYGHACFPTPVACARDTSLSRDHVAETLELSFLRHVPFMQGFRVEFVDQISAHRHCSWDPLASLPGLAALKPLAFDEKGRALPPDEWASFYGRLGREFETAGFRPVILEASPRATLLKHLQADSAAQDAFFAFFRLYRKIHFLNHYVRKWLSRSLFPNSMLSGDGPIGFSQREVYAWAHYYHQIWPFYFFAALPQPSVSACEEERTRLHCRTGSSNGDAEADQRSAAPQTGGGKPNELPALSVGASEEAGPCLSLRLSSHKEVLLSVQGDTLVAAALTEPAGVALFTQHPDSGHWEAVLSWCRWVSAERCTFSCVAGVWRCVCVCVCVCAVCVCIQCVYVRV